MKLAAYLIGGFVAWCLLVLHKAWLPEPRDSMSVAETICQMWYPKRKGIFPADGCCSPCSWLNNQEMSARTTNEALFILFDMKLLIKSLELTQELTSWDHAWDAYWKPGEQMCQHHKSPLDHFNIYLSLQTLRSSLVFSFTTSVTLNALIKISIYLEQDQSLGRPSFFPAPFQMLLIFSDSNSNST